MFNLENPSSAGDLSTELFDTNSHFLYPYDDFEISMGVELNYRILHDDQVLSSNFVYPQFFVSTPTSVDWIAKTSQTKLSDTFLAQGYETDMKILTTIAFSRPIFMKVIYPLLISAMALFILLLALVDSVDTFIEGGVAVFFGIFGLKQIILPSTTEITTVWDFAIWGLVIIFAVSLIDHLISSFRRIFRGKNKIKSCDEIKPQGITHTAVQNNKPPTNITSSRSKRLRKS